MGVVGGVGARALKEEEESLFETISFFLPADADEGDALDADTDDCFCEKIYFRKKQTTAMLIRCNRC